MIYVYSKIFVPVETFFLHDTMRGGIVGIAAQNLAPPLLPCMPKKKKAARERSLLLSGQPLVLSGYTVLVLFIEENKGHNFHVLGTRVGERVFLAFGTDGHITGAYLYLCAVVVVHAVPF